MLLGDMLYATGDEASLEGEGGRYGDTFKQFCCFQEGAFAAYQKVTSATSATRRGSHDACVTSYGHVTCCDIM